ncbi:MAG: DUF1080 domain-containing protein [Isosphaeraceae bacterium]|nr:DUF1080 domain-containing protein [Isosphaeraceae bacterium]
MRSVVLSAALLCIAIAPARAGEIPAWAKELPKVETRDPVLAFNGKDLAGFYTYLHDNGYKDPRGVFTVADGMLRISGEEWGGIATKEEFGDYHLVVEWKWGTKTWGNRAKASRDSGILLHCVGPDGAAGGHWMESQECQIIEGGCGDLLMVGGKGKPSLTCEVRIGPDKQFYYEKGGMPVTRNGGRYNWWGRDPKWKDVLGYRGPDDVEKPTGEWNRMEVICDGGTIINIVNGYVVNVGTDSSVTRGKIMIQSEGAELFVRKIEIRPLVKK